MNDKLKQELLKFINEGIIKLDFSHDDETVGYVNATKKIKELYNQNSFTKFTSLLYTELDKLNNLKHDSFRIQGKKFAYQDVINEIKRLENKEEK